MLGKVVDLWASAEVSGFHCRFLNLGVLGHLKEQ